MIHIFYQIAYAFNLHGHWEMLTEIDTYVQVFLNHERFECIGGFHAPFGN